MPSHHDHGVDAETLFGDTPDDDIPGEPEDWMTQAESAGWSDRTLLQVIDQFLTDNNLQADLDEHVRDLIAQENAECQPEGE